MTKLRGENRPKRLKESKVFVKSRFKFWISQALRIKFCIEWKSQEVFKRWNLAVKSQRILYWRIPLDRALSPSELEKLYFIIIFSRFGRGPRVFSSFPCIRQNVKTCENLDFNFTVADEKKCLKNIYVYLCILQFFLFIFDDLFWNHVFFFFIFNKTILHFVDSRRSSSEPTECQNNHHHHHHHH